MPFYPSSLQKEDQMSYTTVAELRTALGVGTLYADATLQSVCDAADNVLIPFLWTNSTPVIAHSNNGTAGVLYFNDYVQDVFYVGQTITVAGCGSNFNGSKTVNGVGEKSIEITTTHAANVVKSYHMGNLAHYTVEASLIIVDIFMRS